MKPRRWRMWAVIEPDGQLHDVQREGPEDSEPTRGLIALGWTCIPVEVTEVAAMPVTK